MRCENIDQWLSAVDSHMRKYHGLRRHRIWYDNPPHSDDLVLYCFCGASFRLHISSMMGSLMNVPEALRGVLCTDTGRNLLADVLDHPGVVGIDYEQEVAQ